MKHYLIYHNKEVMGYPLNSVSEFIAFTDKKVKDEVVGNKVWIITGEGKPKEYFLKMFFIIDKVQSGTGKNFNTKLVGSKGKNLSSMIRIDNRPWFGDFRKQMANFIGFAEIKQQKYIDELEKLV